MSSKKNLNENHLVFVVNKAEFFVSHRINLARAALREGLAVTLACPRPPKEILNSLREGSIKWKPISLEREKLKLAALFRVWWQAIKLAYYKKSAIFHLVTALPIVLVGPILRIFNRKIVVAISGLGTVFNKDTGFYRLAKFVVVNLYKFILSGANSRLVVQNLDDFDLFRSFGIDESKISLIKGSGVDPKEYGFNPKTELDDVPKILVPARLLHDKGILEACKASGLLRSKGIKHKIIFAGTVDRGNPTSFTEKEIEKLQSIYEDVSFVGFQADIHKWFLEADIVCLPSYHEGLPRSLIEAFAIGRPVVASNVRGCREIVYHEKTGLLAKVKDPKDLADNIQRIIIDKNLRNTLVHAAYDLFLEELETSKIEKSTVSLYKSL